MQFVGYDVFNGHYLKHFKVFDSDGTRPQGVDYLESYEEGRMYSLGVMPGKWTTYESIRTNADVDPDFLQDDAVYPELTNPNFASFMPLPCADDLLWDRINWNTTASASDKEIDAVRAERMEDAERPDLRRYMMSPFDFAEYNTRVIARQVIGNELVNNIFHPNNGTSARSRRDLNCLTGYSSFDRRVMGSNPYVDFSGEKCNNGYPDDIPLDGTQPGPFFKLAITAGGSFNLWEKLYITASGELSMQLDEQDGLTMSGKVTVVIKIDEIPGKITFGLEGAYGFALNHNFKITGSVAVSNCDRKRRQLLSRRNLLSRREPRSWKSFWKKAKKTTNSVGKTFKTAIDTVGDTVEWGLNQMPCGSEVEASLELGYKEKTFAALLAAVPRFPKSVTLTVSVSFMGFMADVEMELSV
jgi:hypothetical protein